MTKPSKNWIECWNEDDLWYSSKLWKSEAELFLRRAEPIIQLKEDDTVLNVGCGPGYLETLLAPRVKSILAVDTSERYIEMCRKNCRMHSNVSSAILDKTAYTDLTAFGRFSLILCVSVVQYYKNMDELESLIRSAQKTAKPGARMLIAGLLLKRSLPGFIWDASCSLLMSIKEGCLAELMNVVYAKHARKSAYESLNNTRVLSFKIEEMTALIKKMGLNAVIIRSNLSVCANRPSILINL